MPKKKTQCGAPQPVGRLFESHYNFSLERVSNNRNNIENSCAMCQKGTQLNEHSNTALLDGSHLWKRLSRLMDFPQRLRPEAIKFMTYHSR